MSAGMSMNTPNIGMSFQLVTLQTRIQLPPSLPVVIDVEVVVGKPPLTPGSSCTPGVALSDSCSVATLRDSCEVTVAPLTAETTGLLRGRGVLTKRGWVLG